MKKYIDPLIKVQAFDASVAATDLSTVTDFIYANEVVNKVSFSEYISQRATSTKVQDVLKFK